MHIFVLELFTIAAVAARAFADTTTSSWDNTFNAQTIDGYANTEPWPIDATTTTEAAFEVPAAYSQTAPNSSVVSAANGEPFPGRPYYSNNSRVDGNIAEIFCLTH